MTTNARRGVLIGTVIFLLLMVLAAPRRYVRLENRAPVWTETLAAPIWMDSVRKFVSFKVGSQGALVPRQDLFDFRNQTAASGVQLTRTRMWVPVTEKGYVRAGYDLTVVAAYAFMAAAAGLLVSLTPAWWAGLGAALVAAGLYIASYFRRPRGSEPAIPPGDADSRP